MFFCKGCDISDALAIHSSFYYWSALYIEDSAVPASVDYGRPEVIMNNEGQVCKKTYEREKQNQVYTCEDDIR